MFRKKNGFTLIELLATLVILGVILSITVISITNSFKKAKAKSEEVFVKTVEDAMEMYLDYDAKQLSYGTTQVCTVNKTHKDAVKVYRNTGTVTLANVIGGTYSPLQASDMVNPANKETPCLLTGEVTIYRDEDYVYYYKMNRSALGCLTSEVVSANEGILTNLPSSCR